MAAEVQIPIELKYRDDRSLSRLGNDLSRVALSTDKFNKELLQLATAANQAERELKDISNQIAQNGFATPEQLNRVKQLSSNIRDYKDEIREAVNPTKQIGTELDGLENSSERLSGVLGGIGRTLSTGIVAGGGAAVAILREAGQAAIEFESSFAGVIKTTDGLQDEFGNLTADGAALRAQFRELATINPIDVNQLNAIGELGGQLGVARQDIISFTDTISKLDLTTNLNAEEAAQQLAQMQNVLQLTQDDVERSGSAIVALGNNFATTERDILGFNERITGAGAIAKLSASELLGISTAFSSVGINAEAGGTAVQKVLFSLNGALLNGGQQLESFAAAAGLTTAEFRNLAETDPAGAFTAFVSGLGNAGDEAIGILENLELKDSQLQRAFLSLANSGDLLERAISTSNDAFAENAALTAEAEVRFATTESQIQLAKNAFSDLAIELGQNLLPAFGSVAEAATRSTGALGDFLQRESTQGYFDSFNQGLNGFLGNYEATLRGMIDRNIEGAQSVEDLSAEFSRILSVSDELNSASVFDFGQGLGDESAERVVQEIARVSGSYEDFIDSLVKLRQEAIAQGSDFNPYDVTGQNEEIRAFFDTYNDGFEALIFQYAEAGQAQEEFFAPNNADAQIQAYADISDSIDSVTTSTEDYLNLTIEQTKSLEELRAASLRAFGQSESLIGDLLSAQADFDEATFGRLAGIYEGDVVAAEEAQGRISSANEAIADSYRQTAFDALLAQTGVTEESLNYAVAVGLVSQEEADLRLEYTQTTTALDTLASSTAFMTSTLDDQVEATNLLINGYASTAEQALGMAQQLDGPLAESLRTNADLTQNQIDLLNELSGKEVSAFVNVDFRGIGTDIIDPATGQYADPQSVSASTGQLNDSGRGDTNVNIQEQNIYANETASELSNAVGDLGI